MNVSSRLHFRTQSLSIISDESRRGHAEHGITRARPAASANCWPYFLASSGTTRHSSMHRHHRETEVGSGRVGDYPGGGGS